MVPDCMAQCQQIATVLLSNHLVAAREVEHQKRLVVRVWCHQSWVLQRVDDATVEQYPVAILQVREEIKQFTTAEYHVFNMLADN